MVLGIFNSRFGVEEAINELERSGFDAKDISIIMRDDSPEPPEAGVATEGISISLGVPAEEAGMYESRINEGGMLVAVPSGIGMADLAADILARAGAEQIRKIETINRRAEGYNEQRSTVYYHEIDDDDLDLDDL